MTHKSVSFVKSVVRLAACVAWFYQPWLLPVGLFAAELLGFLEELVDKRPEGTDAVLDSRRRLDTFDRLRAQGYTRDEALLLIYGNA